MTRPFLVRFADLIAFLVVAYVILSFATNLMIAVANWPDPGRWIAIFFVGATAITCAIKIGPISRGRRLGTDTMGPIVGLADA